MADREKDLGTFIGEQNPFTQEMRLPPDWQTDETIVTFPSVADFWAKLMQDPSSAVSKVIRITYTAANRVIILFTPVGNLADRTGSV